MLVPFIFTFYADMAELADALDSGSSEHLAHAGSSPVIRRAKGSIFRTFLFFLNFCGAFSILLG